MSPAADFQCQIASIMEVLANAAVAEICKVVDDGYSVVQLEISRSLKESEVLRRKITLLEVQLARCRAERGRTAEGSSRYTGVRLLRRQSRESSAGTTLQGRTRFLNRGPPQLMQKALPIILDQDPDQEVVTTTKTESTEPEEQKPEELQREQEKEEELVIVKVEEATETGSTNQEAPQDGGRQLSETEVGGSDTVTFASRIPDTDSQDPAHTAMFTGSDATTQAADMMPHASCDNVTDDRKSEEVIVIDGGSESQREGGEGAWSNNTQVPRELDKQTTISITQCTSQEMGPVLPPDDNSRLHRGGYTSGVSLHRPASRGTHLAFYHAATMERPYACSRCSKRFFLQTDLQRHAARHTRHKPYACLLCGKSFVCQSQLDIHHNVHTGERPFTCAVCSRRFSHPSNLRRHLKVQH